jgi:hypothetical protein
MATLQARIAKLEADRRPPAPKYLVVIANDERELERYRAANGRNPKIVIRVSEEDALLWTETTRNPGLLPPLTVISFPNGGPGSACNGFNGENESSMLADYRSKFGCDPPLVIRVWAAAPIGISEVHRQG